jgi:NHL repeat
LCRGANSLNGSPEQPELSQPHGATVHRDRTLYIADSSNGRIVKITK